MRVVGLPSGFERLGKYSSQELEGLSAKAQNRFHALNLLRRHHDVGETTQEYRMGRATLYRWRKRFNPRDWSSLEDRSRRPHRVRRPSWSPEAEQSVLELRGMFPRWGKQKLTILLAQQQLSISCSTVGRILQRLRRQGRLVEPPTRPISATRCRPKRPYAKRKPREYQPRQPGDLVQIDTLDVRPLPGVVMKQFTARDVVSRWDVLDVYSRLSSTIAATFLDTVQQQTPFPIKAVQVDGGSEFYAEFERACQQRQIQLFVLPPKSPKLNAHVERANRTHTEEFWEVYDVPWTVKEARQEVRDWQQIYNCLRPHQSLGGRTPLQFLQDTAILPKASSPPRLLSHMS